MTIAMGLLCDRGEGILLAADTMVSYGSVSSNQGGSKIYDLPLGFFAAVADDVSQTHIFISKVADELEKLSPDDEALLDKTKFAIKNTCEFMFKWKRSEILNVIGLTDREYLYDTKVAPELRKKAERLLMESEPGIEIIVVGYGTQHTIFLYTDGREIREQTSPGFFLAGSGGSAALHWLNCRQQNVTFSRGRSYAHILEAMAFAKLSPFVGRNFGCLLLRRGKPPEKLSETGDAWANDCKDRIWLRPTIYLDADAEKGRFDRDFGIK